MTDTTTTAAPVEVGVKETKEMLVGVFAVATLLVARFKDGVGVDDAAAIYDKLKNDAEFKAVITAAYLGYEQIPGEVKDIDVGEGFELAGHMLPEILKLIKACVK